MLKKLFVNTMNDLNMSEEMKQTRLNRAARHLHGYFTFRGKAALYTRAQLKTKISA